MVGWQNFTSRFVSSEIQCCVVWQTVTVVPEEISASIYRASAVWKTVDYKGSEDGVSKFLWNVRNYLPIEMGSYSGRHSASSTLVWEYRILKYYLSVSCCKTTNIYIWTVVRIPDTDQCCVYSTYNRCDWNVVYKEYRQEHCVGHGLKIQPQHVSYLVCMQVHEKRHTVTKYITLYYKMFLLLTLMEPWHLS